MINPIKSDYEHLLPSLLLPKMDDPGMPTIHRSINQRNFQRSCPQHRNMHYLSVRNMVPTLTSSKRRGLSLNGGC
jgi:hypothetical protein